MPKDKLTDYSATNASNTDIGGVNIDEGMLPSAVNNSIRELMTHLKNFSDGTDAITGLTVDGNIKLDGNYPTGTNNVALGNQALDDGSLSGDNNTAVGATTLSANTSGGNNAAFGFGALDVNTTGSQNTGLGVNALGSNTTSSNGTAVGFRALRDNTGSDNTAVGNDALLSNTTGARNVAVGVNALDANTTSSDSTAIGYNALTSKTGGFGDLAIGTRPLQSLTTGHSNVAIGTSYAGYPGGSVTTGTFNTMVGNDAGYSATTGTVNTFIGNGSGGLVTTGSKNTVLGAYNGNQGGLDIRTSSNHIVLSDGDGNPRAVFNASGGMSVGGVTNDSYGGVPATNTMYGLVASGAYALGLTQNTTSAGGGRVLGLRNVTDFNNTGNEIINYLGNTTQRFVVVSNGNVYNTNNSYGAISDQKLKEQIIDASSQWDDIKALTIRKYKMKDEVLAEGDSNAAWKLGVVAQELETAGMGGLVDERIDRDEDGNDAGTTTKSVKYSVLYMKAIKALQEAMDRIETLEAKVATLEGAN